MDKKIIRLALKFQKNEITEHKVYLNILKKIKNKNNQKILKRIADDELKHYNLWKNITKKDVKPNYFKIHWYLFLSKIFGLLFSLGIMEGKEKTAFKDYSEIKKFQVFNSMIDDEQRHEKDLIKMISEERIEYASSIVLGLNDALVELTGALTGLTFALQDTRIIALTGAVVGISASMSMAASEYLSSKEDKDKNPRKSALYTGMAYIFTVALLILPYLLLNNVYLSLVMMLAIAVLIIFGYTFYIATAKSLKFWKRFFEMAIISLTIAAISFGIGILLKSLFNVNV